MVDLEKVHSTTNRSPLEEDNDIDNLAHYLVHDHLEFRDSDDTIIDPIASRHSDRTVSELSRQESKRTYVDFEHGDPENPLNFSTTRKWFITALSVTMTLLAAIAAGAYGLAMPALVSEFGVPSEVATLGVSLYPLGCKILCVKSSPKLELGLFFLLP
jgi:ribose/xylose/arabinose/galactoside ABC-type transport system permease subunit